MSLIFGIALPRRIYLVSDTRVTAADGSTEDDFAKWVDINPRLATVVAGNAHLASWMLRKIIPDVRINKKGWEWHFGQFENYLKDYLYAYALDYFEAYPALDRSACFIFAGFDPTKKLRIEAMHLGEAMGSPVQAAGEGVMVDQTVDMTVMNAFMPMLQAATENGEPVGANAYFDVDLPRPVVIAVTVGYDEENNRPQIKFEYAECLDGIAFNPNYEVERAKLPSLLVGNLEYRNKSDDWESELYTDYGLINTYVHRMLREKSWPSVGGEILPIYVTEQMCGFATGEYVRKTEDGKLVKGGVIEQGGKMHYRDKDDKLKPYKYIYEYLDLFEDESEAKL